MRFGLILDEGLLITEGIVPGLAPPGAMVGLSEKGYLTVALTAHGEGGHSSMPPAQTAVGIVAGAVHRLESNPSPAKLEGITARMFEYLGPEMGFGMRLVFANTWLLGGVVLGKLEAKHSTNATIRTTTAVTVFEGGVKENVLPQDARALVNFRILPGTTGADVIERVREVIDDPRVSVEPLGGIRSDPPAVSCLECPGFEALARSIREIVPEAVVAPGLTVGATDARFYDGLSDSVYRFAPFRIGPDDTGRFHGTDERVSVASYSEAIRFCRRLLENTAGEPGLPTP